MLGALGDFRTEAASESRRVEREQGAHQGDDHAAGVATQEGRLPGTARAARSTRSSRPSSSCSARLPAGVMR